MDTYTVTAAINLCQHQYANIISVYPRDLSAGKSDDAVRAFFVEVHELFVKYLVNPFAAVDGPVVSPLFNQHVKLLAKRILL